MTWNTSPNMNPQSAYCSAVGNAVQRGIAWRLTFEEWWQLWRDHWQSKKHTSLVLARYGDWGAYERGNCRVITREENTAEGRRLTKLVNTIVSSRHKLSP